MRLVYDFFVSLLKRRRVYDNRNLSYFSLISPFVSSSSARTILDVGAGTGAMADMLGRSSFAVALDISKDALKARRKRFFHPVIADARLMPFRNEIFDMTVFISCVEHLSDPFASINEICRISKRDGLCMSQLPNLQW